MENRWYSMIEWCYIADWVREDWKPRTEGIISGKSVENFISNITN